MANLTESPVWEEGVFQLEKTTPPLGGAPAFNGANPSAGHANVQALQLANRTLFIKQSLDSLGSLSDSNQGSALIGSKLDYPGSVGRSQRDKNTDSISSLDFGLTGDGTDETSKLVNLLSAAPFAGKTYLGRNKTYLYSGTLTIPSGSNLITNGSTFRRISSTSGYAIIIEGNVTADSIRLSTPGALNEGGFRFTGSDVSIGKLKFSSDIVNCGGSSAVNAVLISNDSTAIDDVSIKKVYTYNHARPFRAINCSNLDIGRVTGNNFITGMYLLDIKSSLFNGGRLVDPSSLATGGPGQNGVLVEASSDFSTQDVTVKNIQVIGAPEHGFRVGGQSIVDSFKFVGCTSRLSGSGSSPTGGSGFKVLGPNSRGLFHTNISILNCLAEDSGQTSSGNNFNALAFAWVDNATISNFVCSKKTLPFSANGGIILSHLRRTTISNPIVEYTRLPSLRFFEELEDTGVGMYDISVIGGVLHRDQDFDVVTFDPKVCEFDNIRMSGTLIRGGRAAVRAETPSSGGVYTDVYLSFTYVDPTVTSGGPAVTSPNDINYDIVAPWYGTFQAPGKDGSIYRDTTNGLIRIRKGGVWLVLADTVTVGGTWSPVLTNTTNISASVTNTCQYIRVGNVVTVSGFIQVDPIATGAVQLDLSVPVSVDFTGFSQASGFARTDNGDISGIVQANSGLDTLSLVMTATTTNNRNVAFHATYRIP